MLGKIGDFLKTFFKHGLNLHLCEVTYDFLV